MTRGRVGLWSFLALLGCAAVGDGCLIEGEYLPDLPPPDSLSTPITPPKPRCGDAVVHENEQCDDGNAVDGDGCSALCAIEVCWTCDSAVPGATSRCGPQCDSAKGELCVAGVCVSCSDGVRNGDESDVDCGGRCGPCGLGQACAAGGDCGSSFCTGGVCCNEACDGVCTQCNNPAFLGICAYVQENLPDEASQCSGASACDGKGSCKKVTGEACEKGVECVSGKCVGALCE